MVFVENKAPTEKWRKPWEVVRKPVDELFDREEEKKWLMRSLFESCASRSSAPSEGKKGESSKGKSGAVSSKEASTASEEKKESTLLPFSWPSPEKPGPSSVKFPVPAAIDEWLAPRLARLLKIEPLTEREELSQTSPDTNVMKSTPDFQRKSHIKTHCISEESVNDLRLDHQDNRDDGSLANQGIEIPTSSTSTQPVEERLGVISTQLPESDSLREVDLSLLSPNQPAPDEQQCESCANTQNPSHGANRSSIKSVINSIYLTFDPFNLFTRILLFLSQHWIK